MTFRADFIADVQPAIMDIDALGEPATVTLAGGGDPISANVVRHLAVLGAPDGFGFSAMALESHDEISLQVADVGRPARGSTVLVDGVTYTLESVVADNGVVVRFIVKEA